jgi:hypothetical protein
MNLDMTKLLAGKRALRRDLAARPVAEKLRLLDALRERELAIRGRGGRRNVQADRPTPEPR